MPNRIFEFILKCHVMHLNICKWIFSEYYTLGTHIVQCLVWTSNQISEMYPSCSMDWTKFMRTMNICYCLGSFHLIFASLFTFSTLDFHTTIYFPFEMLRYTEFIFGNLQNTLKRASLHMQRCYHSSKLKQMDLNLKCSNSFEKK